MKNITEQMDIALYCSDLGIEARRLIRAEMKARVTQWRGEMDPPPQDALGGGAPRRFDQADD